jgi:transposase
MQFEYDGKLYKSRNIIERLFGRFKDWRQLSLRTFRCPKTFLAVAYLASIVIHYL